MRVREDIGKRRRVKYEVTSGGREEGLNMEGWAMGRRGVITIWRDDRGKEERG